jgi:hypothetical protein
LPPLLLERYLEAAEKVAAAAIPDVQSLSQRWQAERATRRGQGGRRDGMGILSTNASFSSTIKLRWAGQYIFRTRVYGQQAGPQRVRMALRVDGRNLVIKTVPNERQNPGIFAVKVRLKPGTHDFAVAFMNDYFNPKASNRKDRDRNLVVDWFEIQGPYGSPDLSGFEQSIKARRKPGFKRSDWAAAASEALSPIARRAHRRLVTSAEFKRIMSFFELAVKHGASFEGGLQAALTYLLVSPHFIYRVEIDKEPDNEKAVRDLTDHELATRLSYFLWASLGDEQLSQIADSGQLRAQLTVQVRRMLDDPRSSRFVEQFAGQWLQLRRLVNCSPDPDLFPGFDEKLIPAMGIETEMFFEAILRENRSVMDLLDGQFTFANGRLAKHYGIKGVTGDRWRRVRVADGRGGVLGHASILTLSSNPTRSSPVKRGKWILETLLDDPPPPPPPGNDSLAPLGKAHQDKALTLRQRFEIHRQNKACALCHDRLDPLGFALENFNGIGAWRDRIKGRPIDVSAKLPGGQKFYGLKGLRDTLRSKKARIVRALVRNLMVFALGRGTLPSDAAAIDSIVQKAAPDYRLSDLIVSVVTTKAFQKRRGEDRFKGKKKW